MQILFEYIKSLQELCAKLVMRQAAYLLFFALLNSCTSQNDNSFGNLLEDLSNAPPSSASIAIQSFLPTSVDVVIKTEDSESFIVSAVGEGQLNYTWTLDNVPIGTNSPSLFLLGPGLSVGSKVLKVTITDSRGSLSQQWNVKINGTPTIDFSNPAISAVGLRRGTNMSFAVSASDPNADSLSYTWKLNGLEGILSGSGASVDFTPLSTHVGANTITVDIYDGPSSDVGTYKVTKSWTVNVNHFYDGCNDLENNQLLNRTCVYSGIASTGEGVNPLLNPTDFLLRPTALFVENSGSMFIADDYQNIIYYWNKTGAPVSLLGIDVPANTAKVVAGTGTAGAITITGSDKAIRTPLNAVSNVYYDGSNLFLSSASNNIVQMINSSGVISTVLGGGASNVDGVAATTHSCTTPYGIAKSGNDLFVACYGLHRVKRVDLLTGLAYTFAGTGAAGDPTNANESAPTDASNGKLRNPYGLIFDPAGNLYISEYSGCRVRMVNRSGGPITLFGSYIISNNMMRVIVGNVTAATCSYVSGEAVNLTGAADARVHNPRYMEFYNNTLYITQYGNSSIVALNFSVGDVAYGNTTVTSYYSTRIIGNGTAGYQGEGSSANLARFYRPFDVKLDPSSNTLVIADYQNYRVRRIAADYTTELVLGSGVYGRKGNAGNGLVEASSERMNLPRQLAYDKISGELFYSDTSNYRIRKVDKFGQVTTAIGTGVLGLGAEEDDYPTNVTMNGARGINFVGATASFGGHIIYSDTVNHRIRFYNRSASDVTYFGVTIQAGKVGSVAGTGSAGNGIAGPALSAALNNPESVTSDGVNLYISDSSNHCIKKVDSLGDISVAAGTCGTAGNVNGVAGVGRLNNPADILYYKNGSDEGLFIADRNNNRIRFTRIAGFTPIAGVPISGSDTNTVACGGTYHNENIIASNSICNQIYSLTLAGSKVCFTNYNYHNARCFDVSSGIIYTLMGPAQGTDAISTAYFPGSSFSNTNQNNVIAASGSVDPPLSTDVGVLNAPIGITSDGSNKFFIAEWGTGLIRKVVGP